ncbi:hypothetical protein O7632_14765 [Solwaraspora sp. WMMD406]|nr:hypothetical protein [Solwaraspora sp. WMMD406]MDG4765346.1 hypothetical protein [Solwaraspora sp. WMMD406]
MVGARQAASRGDSAPREPAPADDPWTTRAGDPATRADDIPSRGDPGSEGERWRTATGGVPTMRSGPAASHTTDSSRATDSGRRDPDVDRPASAVRSSAGTAGSGDDTTGSAYVPDASRVALADDDPPDEPAAEATSAADSARVARLPVDVVVVDGRPRYHRDDCVHLMARDGEALPVGEAIELGFTPCGLCTPNSALLAESGRV